MLMLSDRADDMRILVIEDERKVAEFVARGLRDQRFAVDVVNDGQAGWRWPAPAIMIWLYSI